VDANRVENGTSEAVAVMSYGGDGKERLAARAAAWRARGRPAGGAKAVGELGGNAWSVAGVGDSLGRHGTRVYGGAVARQRRRQRRKKKGVPGANLQFPKIPGTSL
jgi:hypothetical protein